MNYRIDPSGWKEREMLQIVKVRYINHLIHRDLTDGHLIT